MMEKLSLRSLPAPLLRKILLQCLTAVLLAAAALVSAAALREPGILLIFIGCAYLAGSSLATVLHWNSGRIAEVAAVCTGVVLSSFSHSNVKVFFKAETDPGLELPGVFLLPRKGCPYAEGASYTLYIDTADTGRILACTENGMH